MRRIKQACPRRSADASPRTVIRRWEASGAGVTRGKDVEHEDEKDMDAHLMKCPNGTPLRVMGQRLNWMGFQDKAQMVKSPPAMQETGVRSLGWKDPLEKGMATHSSILAWRIPWTEKPGGLQSMGFQRVRHD